MDCGGALFREERDRRAGEDANRQKKGRITRELRAELEKALADRDDQEVEPTICDYRWLAMAVAEGFVPYSAIRSERRMAL